MWRTFQRLAAAVAGMLLICAVAVAAPITFVGSGAVADNSAGNVKPGYPGGWQAGDLLLCIVEARDNVVLAMPAGWATLSAANSGGAHRATLFWKIAAAGDDPTPTLSHAGGNSIIARIIGFANVDLVTPFDTTSSFTVSTADLTTEAGAVTTVTPETMLIFTAHMADNHAGIGPPSGSTPWTLAFFNETGDGSDSSIAAYYGIRSAAGVQAGLTATRSGAADAISHGAQIALRPAAATVVIDHFAITVGAAASTCAAQSVTIAAKDAADATLSGYVGTVVLTNSSAHGGWTTVTASGTLSETGTTDDGQASYTFAAGDSGVVTLALVNTHADDLTLTVVDSALPATVSTSGTVNFRDSTFVILPDPIQVAGRNQNLTASLYTRVGGGCVIDVNYTGAKNLDAWLTLDADHPAGATLPTIGALTLPSVAPAQNPGLNNLALAFSNGTANLALGSVDVGKYLLNLRDDTFQYAHAVVLSGASGSITTRPWLHVAVPGNPGAGLPTGAVFTSAGTSFSATVRGVLWQGADDVDNDGVADGGADLADNAVAPRFAWATTLTAVPPFTPATPADAPAGTAVAGTLDRVSGGNTVAAAGFGAGAATTGDWRYSEVGSFTLRAEAGGYLNSAGLDLMASASPVGRFTPHHFDVTVTPGCGSFNYSGQPFDHPDTAAVTAATATARNAAGQIVGNYHGPFGFAKDVTFSNAGVSANFSNNLLAAADFTFGIGSDLDLAYTFVAKQSAPLTLTLRAADGDGVSSAGQTEESVEIRSGRLVLQNAYGSELLPLPLPLRAEYYGGGVFTVNAADSCTGYAAAAALLGNYQKNLQAGETLLSGGPSTLAAGVATLLLSAPGNGNDGSVDVTLTVSPWLQFDWDGNGVHDNPPLGRASFGLYKGSPRLIYLRESVQ